MSLIQGVRDKINDFHYEKIFFLLVSSIFIISCYIDGKSIYSFKEYKPESDINECVKLFGNIKSIMNEFKNRKAYRYEFKYDEKGNMVLLKTIQIYNTETRKNLI